MTDPQIQDPSVPDWHSIKLPDTWADQLNFKNPADLLKFLKRVFIRKGGVVKAEPDMFGAENIPKYVLQEFHNLPNGNYSRKISRGYITGFDHVMLGEMSRIREIIAERFKHYDAVLDAGCGGGHTAEKIAQAGVNDVWGVDPSPYLLKHAAEDNPSVSFVQGVIEQPIFPANRFDAVCANFLFHEIPPRYAEKALKEIYKILKPGGELYIAEPSPLQLSLSYGQAIKQYGWKGFYFKWLAGSVNEPFLEAWHKFANKENLQAAGFTLESDDDHLPIRTLILKKPLSDD